MLQVLVHFATVRILCHYIWKTANRRGFKTLRSGSFETEKKCMLLLLNLQKNSHEIDDQVKEIFTPHSGLLCGHLFVFDLGNVANNNSTWAIRKDLVRRIELSYLRTTLIAFTK